MDVWATLVVARSQVPVPPTATLTGAVVEGWECWLLPAERLSLQRLNFSRMFIMVTVLGSAGGEGWVSSGRGIDRFEIVAHGSSDFRLELSATRLERFIKASGPRGVRRADVGAIGTASFASPLEAVHALLVSLRLARERVFAAEDFLGGHAADSAELPDVFRSDARGAAIRAVALDHDSVGWRRLVAIEDLYDFGEPPCVVSATPGGLFVASDPPVSLRSFYPGDDLAAEVGGVAGWVDVPESASGSVESFVAWSRSNVGTERAPVSGRRRQLRGEVPDELPGAHEQHFIGWPYQIASLPTLALTLTSDTGSPTKQGVDALLAVLRSDLVDAIANGYRSLGGTVSHSDYGMHGEPTHMLLIMTAEAGRDRDMHPYDPLTDAGWRSASTALVGRGRDVFITIEVCNPLGFAVPLRWGKATVRITPGSETTPTGMQINVSSALLLLAGSADRITNIASVAINHLRLRVESATVGRSTTRSDWLVTLTDQQLRALGGITQIEASGLFHSVTRVGTQSAPITLLQATETIEAYDTLHAQAVARLVHGEYERPVAPV